MTHQSSTFYVLHPLLEVFLENVGVVILPCVAGPEVESAVVGVAVSGVAEPVVVFVAVVFVAVVSVPDVAEPQASVDTRIAFHVLVVASGVVVEVDTPGRPRSRAFPSVDYHASPSSSVEVVGRESVHSATGVRTNDGLCSILSNPGLRQNKNLELCHNKPNPGHNNVSDTNDLPMDATTSHSRKRSLHLYQGQRRHTSQVSLSPPVVREIQWAAAEEN